MDDETKADAPLTPDEERALREAWACIGPGLAAAELVAGSTGRLLATVDSARRERDEAVEALAKLRAGAVVSDLHRANQLGPCGEVRREKAELAARVDGAVAKADLLRDVARHERDVYAHVIARLRDALRLDAGASLSDVLKRAEELAARGER